MMMFMMIMIFTTTIIIVNKEVDLVKFLYQDATQTVPAPQNVIVFI